MPDPDSIVHRLPRVGIVIIDPGPPKTPHEAATATHDDANGAS